MKAATWMLLGTMLALPAWAGGRAVRADPDEGTDAQERWTRKARTLRTLELAEVLGLNEADALKLSQRLAPYEAKREPLQSQLLESARVLRRASMGDATAFAQVDGALQKIPEIKRQIEQLDAEMFRSLAQDLGPQQKARLALTFARLPRQMREMAREGRGRGRGGAAEE